jgi:hypothetical protein
MNYATSLEVVNQSVAVLFRDLDKFTVRLAFVVFKDVHGDGRR